MGNLMAPSVPTSEATSGKPNACPECGHSDGLVAPEFSLVRALFGRQPKPYTCAHVEVEQDALVDNLFRCACSTSWHIA